MKILAVDDDLDFLAVFAAVLRSFGYSDVETAGSGVEALAKIRQDPIPYDCLILDIQMPGMDGIDLCGRIRAMAPYRNTPIVMNTIVNDRSHIIRAFAAGATDYLTKPIDELEIRTRLSVIETLVWERRRALPPAKSAAAPAAPTVGFMDSIPMKRVDCAIDLFAMGNYLKTLGMFRALSISVLTVRVSNARRIHELEGGSVFTEVMIDVAMCLSDCLKPRSGLVAYAGGGIFVCLLSSADLQASDNLCTELTQYLSEFEAVYGDLDIIMPEVSVSSVIRCRATNLRSPTKIIDEAIATARLPDSDAARWATMSAS